MPKMLRLCFFQLLFLSFNPQLSFANESQIQGIVQYSDGVSHIGNSKDSAVFKDLVGNDQQINVLEKSKLKIVFQNDCIVVLYGPANLKTPKLSSDAIEITGASRWICKGNAQKLLVEGKEYEIKNSEVLFYPNHVALTDNDLKLNTPLMSELDKTYEYPSESIRREIYLDSQIHHEIRFFLLATPIGYGGFIHSHSDYNNTGLQTNGIRLASEFKLWDKNWFTFLGYFVQNNNGGDSGCNGMGACMPKNFNNSHVEYGMFGVGLRQNDVDVDHSLFYYAGLGSLKFQASIGGTSNGMGSNYFNGVVNHYALILGGGYEKIFFSKSWISFYVSVEAQIAQTLNQGYISTNYNTGGPPPVGQADATTGLTTYNIFVNIGPAFNF